MSDVRQLRRELRRQRQGLDEVMRTAERLLEDAEHQGDVDAVRDAALLLGALMQAAHALDEPRL